VEGQGGGSCAGGLNNIRLMLARFTKLRDYRFNDECAGYNFKVLKGLTEGDDQQTNSGQ